jgi:hypothetical protein
MKKLAHWIFAAILVISGVAPLVSAEPRSQAQAKHDNLELENELLGILSGLAPKEQEVVARMSAPYVTRTDILRSIACTVGCLATALVIPFNFCYNQCMSDLELGVPRIPSNNL